MKINALIPAFLLLLSSCLFAQTPFSYVWNGSANDGDWTNAANWLDGIIPIDDATTGGNNQGLTISSADSIVFNGTNLPFQNVPDLGGNVIGNGTTRSTPNIIVNSGDAEEFVLVVGGRNNAYWTNPEGLSRDVLTVGDGMGDDVTVVLQTPAAGVPPLLQRHPGAQTFTFTVNSDGILIFVAGADFGFANPVDRFARIDIVGGTVILEGPATDLNTSPGTSVNLLAAGSSFTAEFGSDFLVFEDVTASLGTNFTSAAGVVLAAVDNGDNTFTVSAEAAPDPNYWTGTGGAGWDLATSLNFTTNLEADPLMISTFADAVSISQQATFADNYFDEGAEVDVATAAISIASGGVSTGLVDFLNVDTDYTVTSVDTEGITDATSLRVAGGGVLTLLGDHAYTGPTTVTADSTLNIGDGATDGTIANSVVISNEGSITFNTVLASSSLAADISGEGSFTKEGPETLTVTGDSGFSGPLVVNGGTLINQQIPGSATYEIAAGAVFELAFPTAGNFNLKGEPTLNGGGTLRINSDPGANLFWPVTAATLVFDSGALVDVQSGTFNGGLGTPEIWTGNLSDLNVETGAQFLFDTTQVEMNVLTGEGTISGNVGGILTFGLDGGSDDFDGVLAGAASYRKEGDGIQTLTGANTYTGNTLVNEGGLILAPTGSLTFAPTFNATSNQITDDFAGGGTIAVDGQFQLDFGQTELIDGNSWLLVDDTNAVVTYGTTFAVDSTAGAFTEGPADTWTLVDGGNTWTFEEGTGTLSLVVVGGAVVEGVVIESCDFNASGGFEVNFSNLDATAGVMYQLRRSTDIESGFTLDVGAPLTGSTVGTVTDTAPPTGQAFYQLFLLP